MAFPTDDELRAASLSLRIDSLLATMPTAADVLAHASEMAYYTTAAAIGVTREQADACLRQVQGPAAGSTPTTEELAAARRLMYEGLQ